MESVLQQNWQKWGLVFRYPAMREAVWVGSAEVRFSKCYAFMIVPSHDNFAVIFERATAHAAVMLSSFFPRTECCKGRKQC
jgi:hypothetical protein